ncbi:MAG TPA: hypothetical protein VF277_00225, partial [Steroidobacteraceae bacterium]
SDWRGDRFRDAFVCAAVMAGGVLTLGFATTPTVVMGSYLVFAVTCFAIPMLTSSAWADVLHVRQLAVGAAAINTMSQIGAFAMPYAWGAAKDATGSYEAGLIGLALVAASMALLILHVRSRVRSERSARVLALAAS